jgi:hypothetical protein
LRALVALQTLCSSLMLEHVALMAAEGTANLD